MTNEAGPGGLLADFSGALETLAVGAVPLVATVSAGAARNSAIWWQADLLVTSEQSLAKAEAYRAVLAGGAVVAAHLVGRDPGTNVAALRVAGTPPQTRPGAAEPRLGGLAVALAGDGAGAATIRLALLHQVGPAWHSQAGGRIDRRIELDARLSQSEEGGPVLGADGMLLGMSTLGPRRRALVIPTATIERVVQTLLAHGRVARGWLGVALQPVAVPAELHQAAGHQAGLMVLGLSANSPAVAAGVMQGDVILAVDGQPVLRPRALAERFGPESIGSEASLLLLRAGQLLTLTAIIAARP